MEAINEIKILSDVRLVNRKGFANNSKNNLHVQFNLSGDLRGSITCYLCLDKHDLNPTEKNYIFPLFVEAMNILVGKQVSQDKKFMGFKVMLSPPKLSMITQNLKSNSEMQYYELELNSHTFSILTDYNLEALS